MFFSKCYKLFYKIQNILLRFGVIPIEPCNIVIMTIRIVVAKLGISKNRAYALYEEVKKERS